MPSLRPGLVGGSLLETRRDRCRGLAVVVVTALVMSACASGVGVSQRPAVGFVLVGARDDLGYNQAVWEGADAVARTFPEFDVLRIENVPEDDSAIDAMQSLVDDGAVVVFATSFGHLEAAVEVARRNPDVVVVHQGGIEPEPLDNLGTFWGAQYQHVYLTGIAAGAATRSGTLGFVAAFPIPSTRANVNAFTLGARTVRPDVETVVTITEDWCDPQAQAEAVDSLLAAGADVLGFHQDCSGALLARAEAAGLPVVGLHEDGSEVASTTWLTGAVWDWRDAYVAIVEAALSGSFATSPYNGDWRGRLATGDSPLILTDPGPRVSPETDALMAEQLARLVDGGAVFVGPLRDADGNEAVPRGGSLTVDEVDRMGWWLEGVTVVP